MQSRTPRESRPISKGSSMLAGSWTTAAHSGTAACSMRAWWIWCCRSGPTESPQHQRTNQSVESSLHVLLSCVLLILLTLIYDSHSRRLLCQRIGRLYCKLRAACCNVQPPGRCRPAASRAAAARLLLLPRRLLLRGRPQAQRSGDVSCEESGDFLGAFNWKVSIEVDLRVWSGQGAGRS